VYRVEGVQTVVLLYAAVVKVKDIVSYLQSGGLVDWSSDR
jgi:hypothetical protein